MLKCWKIWIIWKYNEYYYVCDNINMYWRFDLVIGFDDYYVI